MLRELFRKAHNALETASKAVRVLVLIVRFALHRDSPNKRTDCESLHSVSNAYSVVIWFDYRVADYSIFINVQGKRVGRPRIIPGHYHHAAKLIAEHLC